MNVHAPALAEALPFDEQTSAFAGDVIGNLSQHPKRLSPKYFYDAAGSELFEQITVLPEYYPTRTELGILRDRGDARSPPSSRKVRRWSNSAPAPPPRCGCCSSAAISAPMFRSTYPAISSTRRPTRLRKDFPGLDVYPVAADFTAPFALPADDRRHAEGRLLPGLDARQFRAA